VEAIAPFYETALYTTCPLGRVHPPMVHKGHIHTSVWYQGGTAAAHGTDRVFPVHISIPDRWSRVEVQGLVSIAPDNLNLPSTPRLGILTEYQTPDHRVGILA